MNLVLIVEDDLTYRALLRSMIHSFYPHAQIIEADNGTDGLCKAMICQPDLIILDGNMPLLNGDEVARTLRSSPKTSSIPLIALSGESDSTFIATEMKRLCNVFLAKPTSAHLLRKTIGGLFQNPLPKGCLVAAN